MMAKTFRRFRLGEISGVDRPAQPLAQAIIMKRAGAPSHSDPIANAKAVQLQGPSAALYTAEQFEQVMMDLAAEQARAKGTTAEMELANGWSDRKSDLCTLGRVWNLMNIVEYKPEVIYQ